MRSTCRLLSLFLSLTLTLPGPALAMRNLEPAESGLEENLSTALNDSTTTALASSPATSGLEELQAELERIDALTEINGVPIEEIEMRARPGQFSETGFLSPDEGFKDVLKADLITLHRLEASARGMTAHLREIIRQAKEVGIQPRERVEVKYNGQKFRVSYDRYHGAQESLFDNRNKPVEGNPDNVPWDDDYVIRNLSNGLEVRISGDEDRGVIGYIERYGFFEGGGQQNRYRVDPEVLYAIIHGLPVTAELKQKDAETADELQRREAEERGKLELEAIVQAERNAKVSKKAQAFFRSMAEILSILQIEQLLLLAESRHLDYARLLSNYMGEYHRGSYEGKDFKATVLVYGLTLRQMDVATPDGKQHLNLIQQIDVLRSVLAEKKDESAGLEEMAHVSQRGSFRNRYGPKIGAIALISTILGFHLTVPFEPRVKGPQGNPAPIEFSQEALAEIAGPLNKLIAEEEYTLRRASPSYNYLHLKRDELKRLEPAFLQYPLQMRDRIRWVRKPRDVIQIQLPEDHPYLVLQFENHPIYHFLFVNKEAEGLAFDRMLIFVEIEPGGMLSENDLWVASQRAELTGGGGNNFRLSDMARFYSENLRQGIALNTVERRILEELIHAGLLVRKGDGYLPTRNAAILSTSRRSSLGVVDHELNHGIYFTDEGYRRAAQQLWKDLPESEKQLISRVVLGVFAYAEGDEDLLIREFVAYFRDVDDLLNDYLIPSANRVGGSKETSRLSRLRPYYDEGGRLKPSVLKTLRSLSERVRALDRYSVLYRQISSGPQEKSQGVAPPPPAAGMEEVPAVVLWRVADHLDRVFVTDAPQWWEGTLSWRDLYAVVEDLDALDWYQGRSATEWLPASRLIWWLSGLEVPKRQWSRRIPHKVWDPVAMRLRFVTEIVRGLDAARKRSPSGRLIGENLEVVALRLLPEWLKDEVVESVDIPGFINRTAQLLGYSAAGLEEEALTPDQISQGLSPLAGLPAPEVVALDVDGVLTGDDGSIIQPETVAALAELAGRIRGHPRGRILLLTNTYPASLEDRVLKHLPPAVLERIVALPTSGALSSYVNFAIPPPAIEAFGEWIASKGGRSLLKLDGIERHVEWNWLTPESSEHGFIVVRAPEDPERIIYLEILLDPAWRDAQFVSSPQVRQRWREELLDLLRDKGVSDTDPALGMLRIGKSVQWIPHKIATLSKWATGERIAPEKVWFLDDGADNVVPPEGVIWHGPVLYSGSYVPALEQHPNVIQVAPPTHKGKPTNGEEITRVLLRTAIAKLGRQAPAAGLEEVETLMTRYLDGYQGLLEGNPSAVDPQSELDAIRYQMAAQPMETLNLLSNWLQPMGKIQTDYDPAVGVLLTGLVLQIAVSNDFNVPLLKLALAVAETILEMLTANRALSPKGSHQVRETVSAIREFLAAAQLAIDGLGFNPKALKQKIVGITDARGLPAVLKGYLSEGQRLVRVGFVLDIIHLPAPVEEYDLWNLEDDLLREKAEGVEKISPYGLISIEDISEPNSEIQKLLLFPILTERLVIPDQDTFDGGDGSGVFMAMGKEYRTGRPYSAGQPLRLLVIMDMKSRSPEAAYDLQTWEKVYPRAGLEEGEVFKPVLTWGSITWETAWPFLRKYLSNDTVEKILLLSGDTRRWLDLVQLLKQFEDPNAELLEVLNSVIIEIGKELQRMGWVKDDELLIEIGENKVLRITLPSRKITQVPPAAGMEEGARWETAESLQGMDDASAKELAGAMAAAGAAGAVLLPKALVESAQPEQLEIDVHGHESVEYDALMALGVSIVDTPYQYLSTVADRARREIAWIPAGQAAVVAIDTAFEGALGNILPEEYPLTLLIEPDSWQPNTLRQKALAALITQAALHPQDRRLRNLIVKLTSDTARAVTLQGTEYVAVLISA